MKNLIRTILIVCLILALGVSMIACGDDEEESSNSGSNKTKTTATDNDVDAGDFFGGKTGTKDDKNNGGEAIGGKTEKSDDKAILEKQGYTVYEITQASLLSTSEVNLGAQAGTMTKMLTASRAILDDSDQEARAVYIYYFSSEAAASACYEKSFKDSINVKLLGSKIVYGDEDNLITK